jgi:hypothetical protein
VQFASGIAGYAGHPPGLGVVDGVGVVLGVLLGVGVVLAVGLGLGLAVTVIVVGTTTVVVTVVGTTTVSVSVTVTTGCGGTTQWMSKDVPSGDQVPAAHCGGSGMRAARLVEPNALTVFNPTIVPRASSVSVTLRIHLGRTGLTFCGNGSTMALTLRPYPRN